MSDTTTVDFLSTPKELSAVGSGPWSVDLQRMSHVPGGILEFARAGGFALYLAMSPSTAVPDPWLEDRRRQSSLTWVSSMQPFRMHRISIIEARAIALEILTQAEAERFKAAEYEASRGLGWEDSP